MLAICKDTEFGKQYDFRGILKEFGSADKHSFYNKFKENVPIHDYEKIHDNWWHRAQKGESDICWPGKINYFALSAGTSGSSVKYIPVTREIIKAFRRARLHMLLSISEYDLPDKLFESKTLGVGGSTRLNLKGTYFEGYISSIEQAYMPFWVKPFYRPGESIMSNPDWNVRLNEIIKNALQWNIGMVGGNPAWVLILMQRIIQHYKAKTIHDIWPNFGIYMHGGVSFAPYRKGFESLLGKPIIYIESFFASEGPFAYQAFPNRRSMRLILDNGIFYEFVPFNEENFTADGEIVSDPNTYSVDEINENQEYALLISTCAGAWRYLLGDVIKFISKKDSEIVIAGRTKHFLNLCGEHLSVDNMNKAIDLVSDELGINIKEYTVAGIYFKSLFGHHWYIGVDKDVDPAMIGGRLDKYLKTINNEYSAERNAKRLGEIKVTVLPIHCFYDWLKMQGKEGEQVKFPRVLNKDKLDNWKLFLKEIAGNST